MIPLPKAAKVRLAEGQPVIPDILAASTPARFRGKPRLNAALCPDGCSICVDACPTQAISAPPLAIDLGACVFCPVCVEACPEGTITYTNDYKMAATSRDGLRLVEGGEVSPEICSREIQRVFGRSLKLRSVSAGGCNGCELELNALGNVNFDMGALASSSLRPLVTPMESSSRAQPRARWRTRWKRLTKRCRGPASSFSSAPAPSVVEFFKIPIYWRASSSKNTRSISTSPAAHRIL